MKLSEDFVKLAKAVRSRHSSVYSALNGCDLTDIETLVRSVVLSDAHHVELYKDSTGRYRIVLFQCGAGVSGVLLYKDGEVCYKETVEYAQGNGYTRQLQALLSSWGIHWYPSEWQTEAGAACYKSDK